MSATRCNKQERARARAVFLVGVDIVDAGWVLFFSLAARDLKLTYLRQQFQVVVSITSRMSHNLVSKTSHEAMYFKVFAHRSQFIGRQSTILYVTRVNLPHDSTIPTNNILSSPRD